MSISHTTRHTKEDANSVSYVTDTERIECYIGKHDKRTSLQRAFLQNI